MPEPDFLVPTIYSTPSLSFGSLGSSTPPIFGEVQQSPERTSRFSFGDLIGYKTSDEFALDAVNNALSYPTSNTVNMDAGSSIMTALKGTAASILQSMGSTGDGSIQPTKASYSSGGGGLLDNPLMLVGLVVGAGALIYMVNK